MPSNVNLIGTPPISITPNIETKEILIASLDSSTTQKGIVQLATQAETLLGTITNKAVTPAGLKNLLDDFIPPSSGENLGDKSVGDIIKLKEDGVDVDFIIVQKGNPNSSIYDNSFNDGIVVLRKDVWQSQQWHTSNVNDYINSQINSRLNSDADINSYLYFLDESVKSQLKTVKIPYRPGSGSSSTVNTGANGMSCKVFLLSGPEVGFAGSADMPSDGSVLSYFQDTSNNSSDPKRVANLNGIPSGWWFRTPYTGGATASFSSGVSGNLNNGSCSNSDGIRPAFVLPVTFPIGGGSGNGNVVSGKIVQEMFVTPGVTTWTAPYDCSAFVVMHGGGTPPDASNFYTSTLAMFNVKLSKDEVIDMTIANETGTDQGTKKDSIFSLSDASIICGGGGASSGGIITVNDSNNRFENLQQLPTRQSSSGVAPPGSSFDGDIAYSAYGWLGTSSIYAGGSIVIYYAPISTFIPPEEPGGISGEVGDIITFKVDGVDTDWRIVQKGKPSSMYDDSFEGTVTLMMENIYGNRSWNSAGSNDYANSTITYYLNNDFLGSIEESIRDQLIEVKIPYRPGSGGSSTINSGANGLLCKAFLLSIPEVGFSGLSDTPYDGSVFSYFQGWVNGPDFKRIGYLNGTATQWWLRSPSFYTGNGLGFNHAWNVYTNGNANGDEASGNIRGVRPCIVLPESIPATGISSDIERFTASDNWVAPSDGRYLFVASGPSGGDDTSDHTTRANTSCGSGGCAYFMKSLKKNDIANITIDRTNTTVVVGNTVVTGGMGESFISGVAAKGGVPTMSGEDPIMQKLINGTSVTTDPSTSTDGVYAGDGWGHYGAGYRTQGHAGQFQSIGSVFIYRGGSSFSGTVERFDPSSSVQIFEAPHTGTYLFELTGAGGGASIGAGNLGNYGRRGGSGATVIMLVALEKGDDCVINIPAYTPLPGDTQTGPDTTVTIGTIVAKAGGGKGYGVPSANSDGANGIASCTGDPLFVELFDGINRGNYRMNALPAHGGVSAIFASYGTNAEVNYCGPAGVGSVFVYY